MKIISLNLHCQQENNIEIINSKIADYIKKNDIDVCLFQEVSQRKDTLMVTDDIAIDNQAYQINQRLSGYELVYHPFKTGFGMHEGVAILTKLPVLDVKSRYISKTKNYETWLCRAYLKVEVLYENEKISFYTTHLGWNLGGETFIEQFDELMKDVEKETNLCILGGDFNTSAGSPEYDHVKEKLYFANELANIDPNLNPTFMYDLDSNHYSINQMIDFFALNKEVEIKDYSFAFNKEEEYVSDHCLIKIEI